MNVRYCTQMTIFVCIIIAISDAKRYGGSQRNNYKPKTKIKKPNIAVVPVVIPGGGTHYGRYDNKILRCHQCKGDSKTMNSCHPNIVGGTHPTMCRDRFARRCALRTESIGNVTTYNRFCSEVRAEYCDTIKPSVSNVTMKISITTCYCSHNGCNSAVSLQERNRIFAISSTIICLLAGKFIYI